MPPSDIVWPRCGELQSGEVSGRAREAHSRSCGNVRRWAQLHSAYGFERRACGGKHLANNSLFIDIAAVLWVAQLHARDENGKPGLVVSLNPNTSGGMERIVSVTEARRVANEAAF